MVSVPASSVVDRGDDIRTGQAKTLELLCTAITVNNTHANISRNSSLVTIVNFDHISQLHCD